LSRSKKKKKLPEFRLQVAGDSLSQKKMMLIKVPIKQKETKRRLTEGERTSIQSPKVILKSQKKERLFPASTKHLQLQMEKKKTESFVLSNR
jgi:hypothetical protein